MPKPDAGGDMSEPALKSCPFCGGTPEIDTLHAYRNFSTGNMETGVSIYCTSCSAYMTWCYPDHPGEVPNKR